MKLILLVFAFIIYIYVSTAEEEGDILNQSIDVVLKYKFGQNFGDTADDNCTKICCRNPPEDVITIFSELVSSLDRNPMDLKNTVYDKDRLTKFCKYANTTANCVRQCSETQRRTFMKKIFSPTLFICEDPYFIESVPCYKAVYDENKLNCSSAEECGPMRGEYDHSLTDYRNLGLDEMHNVTYHQEHLVKSVCKLLDCTLKCNNAKRVEKCGENANRSLKGFYAQIVKTASTIGAEYNYTLPADCNSVGL